jgi:hypothetical protein
VSLRLSGINPLAYMGVEPLQPPALLVIQNRAPTANDSQNVNVGTFWLVVSPQELWYLASLSGYTALWLQLYPQGSSGSTEYVCDTGTANAAGGILNVVGSGQISTSGSGNTVTISLSDAEASQYVTDDGTATPSSSILNVLGGTNINTSAPGSSNTIDVNLNNSVTLTGTLHVEGHTTLDSGVTLTSLTDGVLQTNGSGVVSATNGTNGQVLIGGGTAPVWANITSLGGTVTITNGANSINLETEGGGGPAGTVCFAAYQPSDLFIVPNQDSTMYPFWIYNLGTLAALTVTENEGAAFYPGDGTGTAAVFTAPVNGNYYFSVTFAVGRGASISGVPLGLQGFTNYAVIFTPTLQYASTDLQSDTIGASIRNAIYTTDATVPLTAGQQVTFGVYVLNYAANTTPPGYLFRLYGPIVTASTPPFTTPMYVTKVEGYLI